MSLLGGPKTDFLDVILILPPMTSILEGHFWGVGGGGGGTCCLSRKQCSRRGMYQLNLQDLKEDTFRYF